MTDDIVTRLRAPGHLPVERAEAADEIERLREETGSDRSHALDEERHWRREAERRLEHAEAVIESARTHVQYCHDTEHARELAAKIRDYDEARDD